MELFLVLLVATVYSAPTLTSDCVTCLETSSSHKYCPFYTGASGYCCDQSDSADPLCSSKNYLCTNLMSSSSLKPIMCPFQTTRCGTARDEVSSNIKVNTHAPQQVATTLLFKDTNVCPYIFETDSDFFFNYNIEVTITFVANAECYYGIGTD